MRTDQLTREHTPQQARTSGRARDRDRTDPPIEQPRGIQGILDLAGVAAPPDPPAPAGQETDGDSGPASDETGTPHVSADDRGATSPANANGHLPDALAQWWAYWIATEDVPVSQAHTRRVGAAFAASHHLRSQMRTVLYLCGPAQHTDATMRQLQQLAADLPVEAVSYRLHQRSDAPDPRWTLVVPADNANPADNTHLPQVGDLLHTPLVQPATSKRLTDATVTELAEYKWIPDAARQAASHLDAVAELSHGAAALLAMPTADDECFDLFAESFAWLLSETAVNHPAGG